MADESPSTAGQRFSDDLRRIREDRDVSLDEVHSETRIARTLIESFEEGALYDHPTYNRVYLRSFVKAYAEAIEISQERALDGLDEALDGTYDHELAERFLASPSEAALDPSPEEEASGSPDSAENDATTPSGEEDAEETRSTPGAPTAGGPEGRGGIVGPPRAVGDRGTDEASPAPSPSDSESETDASSGRSEKDEPEEDEAPKSESVDASPADPEPQRPDDPSEARSTPERGDPESSEEAPAWIEGESEAGGEEAPEPDRSAASSSNEGEALGGVGGTGIVGEPTALGSDAPSSESDAPPDPDTGQGPGVSPAPDLGRSSSTNRRIYVIGIGIGIVLLVLVGLGLAYFTTGTTGSTAQSASPATPDTTGTAAGQDTTREASASPPADVPLGETIHLTILATENVSNLRIQRDEDLRRPYWIEEGDASVFPFQEQVTIENELPDIRLLVEGYPYAVQPQDTVGEFELTRAQVQSFVDTLRGEPSTLSVSPDTIPVGEPAEQPQ